MGAVMARARSLMSTFGASFKTFRAVGASPARPAEEELRVGEYCADYSPVAPEDLAQEAGDEELVRASRVISVNQRL